MGFRNVMEKILAVLGGVRTAVQVAQPIISATNLLLPPAARNKFGDRIEYAAAAFESGKSELLAFTDLALKIEALGEIGGVKGDRKIKQLTAGVSQVIAGGEIMLHHEVINNDLFEKSMNGYAQATVDFLKSIQVKAKPEPVAVDGAYADSAIKG